MRAVRGPKRIVNVNVAKVRQRLRKRVVILLLLFMKAQILQSQHIAVLHRLDFLPHFVADAVISKRNRLFQ